MSQLAAPQQPGGQAVIAAAQRELAAARRARFSQRLAAISTGVIAALILVVLIVLGSRGFRWFDASLIGYAVGTIFATAAIAYKYSFWLMRPQTGRYFRRGWQLFFSVEHFLKYFTLIPVAIFNGLLAQTFIRKRSYYRWIMHLCIFWGVIGSLAITLPLTFGWLRFTQVSGGQYLIWVVGFPFFTFDPYSPFGYFIYHALVFAALLLLVGLIMAFHRRFHDVAPITMQRFGFDIVPLALLFAIVLTGVALTLDSTFFYGAYYWFISLTHEAVVVLWLISLPFGKFFHILERPATVGIELYRQVGDDSQAHHCPRCGQAFAAALFIGDLKRTLGDIGQNYAVTTERPNLPVAGSRLAARTPAQASAEQFTWWQDFCPDCKRVMRGEANMTALGREGNQFL
jgi:hypothetical protein